MTGATESLELRKHQPHPAPLSELASGSSDDLAACQSLISAATDGFTPAEGYELYDDTAKDTIAWTHPGYEPIVLRCGIADPDVPLGERVQQINEVPWFEDTTLGEGTTAGTWFALGRAEDLALSAPQDAANSALVRLSDALAEATPEQS